MRRDDGHASKGPQAISQNLNTPRIDPIVIADQKMHALSRKYGRSGLPRLAPCVAENRGRLLL
jgi:hypothetical protein